MIIGYFVIGVVFVILNLWLWSDNFKDNEVCLAGVSLLGGLLWPFALLCLAMYMVLSVLVYCVKFFNKKG